jgi:hypothetical protein
MNALLPDFSQATFESGQPIDNQYFPLTPGEEKSYQGEIYDTEEIVDAVTKEIGSEIAEEITVKFGKEELGDNDNGIDQDLNDLADEIEEQNDGLIKEAVDKVVTELGDEIGDFDPEELAAAITEELTADVLEKLTGEEINTDETVEDFGDRIVQTLDNELDEIAIEIAGEITEAQGDLFGTESNQVYIINDTKEILGVETTVVRDVAWNEGVIVEDTLDWYAQDAAGNVWYMGEFATNYEYDDEGNFIGTNNDGSWEAGVDGAQPGNIMEANPQVGDNYYQEFFQGEAEDQGEVVGSNESVSIDLGNYENVLKTRDFTNLEPDKFEFKYYAPGVGQVQADEGVTTEGGKPELSPELIGISEIPNVNLPALNTANFANSTVIDNLYFTLTPGTLSTYEGEGINPDTGEIETETHEVLVTGETEDILGINSVVVQDQEFVDGILTEDNLSYYAQDAAGSVWLLGESKLEYKYDEQGNVIETNDSDSWLAGEGQSLPGLIMDGTPEVGEGYYQRFDITEAENQAEIVNLDAAIDDFGQYDNILQVKEFSTLESDNFDFEYYAPGVGQIYTEELNTNGDVIFAASLVSVENVSELDLNAQNSAEFV